jgi:hypothetical protein
MTFADGRVVEKAIPSPPGAWKDFDPNSMPVSRALVLKDGKVVALPKPSFGVADVEKVTATFADGSAKVWVPGAPFVRSPEGAPRPVNVAIALKNGTVVNKAIPPRP